MRVCLSSTTVVFATLALVLAGGPAQADPAVAPAAPGADAAPDAPSEPAPDAAPASEPAPELGPEDVVRAQVRALQTNDIPRTDAGIERVWRFAAPDNRAVTGPLERFVDMIHSPAYAPMLGHAEASFGEVQIDGDLAMQTVWLSTADGALVGYVFVLERLALDTCDGCWMTVGVAPADAL